MERGAIDDTGGIDGIYLDWIAVNTPSVAGQMSARFLGSPHSKFRTTNNKLPDVLWEKPTLNKYKQLEVE